MTGYLVMRLKTKLEMEPNPRLGTEALMVMPYGVAGMMLVFYDERAAEEFANGVAQIVPIEIKEGDL